jgi:pyruvate/2-oxoglutarate dehydrogenase complex dihydrolipoamide acyltransferase (E2) component
LRAKSSAWRRARARVRRGRDELSGSTITISSLGPMGGITSTPVINRPEVAHHRG